MKPSVSIALALLVTSCGDEDRVKLGPDGDSGASAIAAGSVTWHGDVAAIFADNCITCHQPGGLMEAIDLHEYDQSYLWRGRIGEMVADKGMPPFPAETSDECPQPWGFQHDRRMSAADIATVLAWIEDDGPEGDPANAQTYTAPEEVHLPRVDQTFTLPEPQNIPPVTEIPDTITCFVLDPQLEETGYMLGMEIKVDNRKVLHHVGNYLSNRDDVAIMDAADGAQDGQFACGDMANLGDALGGYVPGVMPLITPEGSGVEVTPDQVFVSSVHYHGVEDAQVDNSTYDVMWAEEVPPRRARTTKSSTSLTANAGLLPGPHDPTAAPEFFIPANEPWHTEAYYWDPGGHTDRTIYSMLGHMHLVGTEMKVTIIRADGSTGPCVLHIPRWNFDWQLFYTLGDQADPPVLHDGDQLLIECTYNNTLDNPGVVRSLEELGLDEPYPIWFGGGSNEEMCALVLGMVEDG